MSSGEFLLYQTPDGQARIQLRVQDGTVWLTQKQLAELYQVSVPAIALHIRKVFQERELQSEATVKEYLIVAPEGTRSVERRVAHYRLEMVLAIGYRVRSHRGMQFRRWATETLKDYLVKGFVLDDERFKAGKDDAYFEELLARIRDIRSSEKVFWKKVLDIYATSIDYDPSIETSQQFFATVQNKMHWTMDVINDLSRLNRSAGDAAAIVATSAALTQADVQAQVVRRVEELVAPTQAELLPSNGPTVADIVKKTMALVAEHSIDIPRILVKPKGAVQTGYKPFTLDVSKMNFQPQDQQLVGRGLQSGKDVLYGQSSTIGEARPEDYIVRELIGFDDVSYDEHAELIYGLAGQAVAHFGTYLKTEAELHNVLANQGKTIAENIHAQMGQHYYEDIGESEAVVSQGFTPLKPSAVTTEGEVLPLHQPPADRSRIATVVYGGFAKCAYTFQKFHSDTERVLAQVLERDAQRWFRPVQGQFNIYYRRGVEQPEYVPDFVAATAEANLLIETKKAADLDSNEVQAKAKAAADWCAQASAYSARHGGKPWRYLLIPHDAVQVNATLSALAARYALPGASTRTG